MQTLGRGLSVTWEGDPHLTENRMCEPPCGPECSTPSFMYTQCWEESEVREVTGRSGVWVCTQARWPMGSVPHVVSSCAFTEHLRYTGPCLSWSGYHVFLTLSSRDGVSRT